MRPPRARVPQIPESVNSSQNSPCDEEADKEDEGQEGGKPPFVPNRPPSEPPFPPSEEPLHNGFEPSDRPFDAGTPAFPRRGFFGMPARIPRRRNPSRIAFASYAASAYTTFGRVRPRPLPLFFTRKPSSTASNRRRSCSFPGPTTTLKGSPSSFTQTRIFVPFRLLCPSIPTPSPLFSPPPAWNRPPPPPPSPSPAYTPSPEGLAESFPRLPSPGVRETAVRPSDRRYMCEADRTTGSR
jgi:hypothetical protein